MIAIIDYGVGNLFSLSSSLKNLGVDSVVTSDIKTIQAADKLILPGVGAFGDAALKLKNSGLDKVIKSQVQSGKEILGICLGMQLLFERSFEHGEHEGLGLLSGKVVSLKDYLPSNFKIPHIGWNALNFTKQSLLFKYINNKDYVYFVHSYHVLDCEDSLIATTDYEIEVSAAVQKNNIMGCQFHPEKSSDVGLKILKAFCEGVKK